MLSAPRKVLFVSYNLAGGGAERVLANLLEKLDRRKIDPICLFYDETSVYPLTRPVHRRVLGLVGGANRRERIFRIAEAMRELEPGAVLSFLHGVNIEVAAAHLVARRRQRLVVTEHNIASRAIVGERAEAKKRAIRRLYPRTDRVVCVSGAIANDLVSHFGLAPEKTRVIHNPIDLSRVRECAREEASELPWFGEDVPIFINVAALKPTKGQGLLLRAFARVRATRRCRLIFLGEGRDEASLVALATELGVADDVLFAGFRANPFKFMARASAFVLSSDREGFPNVILEAMACGVPVISTFWQGAEEMIDDGKTGTLTPPGDADGLAAAMRRVLLDPGEGARMAQAAARFVSRFAVERILDQYLELFQ